MTKRLEFTPEAIADLDSIWAYTRRSWGLDQARRYTASIREQCERFAAGHRIGIRYDGHHSPLMKLRSGSHVIYLLVLPKKALVVRVLHARQDPDRELP